MQAAYGRDQKKSGEVSSLHVMEDKGMSWREWRIIEGFSVERFFVLEQLFWQWEGWIIGS